MQRATTVAIILGLTFILAMTPTSALDRHGDRSLQVFHKSFALRDGDVDAVTLSQDVREFGSAAFGGHSSLSNEETQLNEFLATVSYQITTERWKSITVDVWVGGEGAPAGYYFRYKSVDANGKPLAGEAFIATDHAFVRANLEKYRDIL